MDKLKTFSRNKSKEYTEVYISFTKKAALDITDKFFSTNFNNICCIIKLNPMDNQHKTLVSELTKLLLGGSAHTSFQEAIKGLNPKLRGVKPDNMPYSIWQLVDHIRIAQWDMLQFSKDADHKSPKWPDEYWPTESEPVDDDAWKGSIEQIDSDLDEFIELLEHSDIYQPLEHGDGQSILREALQLADHNSYHIGEIIAIRRVLGDWKSS
ncbi:DinB family protein [Mucilaginibacter sp. OK098]|uniref:DinB family protein n=1 Tax=Mucilaginibacter sp. OK098 TaxID=1855297 RepID=UPI000911294A|nr:DinB family protein [Mucilaginibacter sp. OK098]SHN08501.1 DinB superfamily protein [Mucilaginibacter sp. OK098]